MALLFEIGKPPMHVSDYDSETDEWVWERWLGDDGCSQWEQMEVADLLQTLIERASLTATEQTVIRHFLAGYEFTEMARRLGCSRQTCAQTFRRAVRKMRQVAEALGISP